MGTKAIDIHSRVPLEEQLKSYLDDVMSMGPSTYTDMYKEIYDNIEEKAMPLDEYVELMDELGIEKKAIVNSEIVRDKIEEYPDRFIPKTGIGIRDKKISDVVAKVEHEVKQNDIRMFDINPYLDGKHANDKKYYPIYQKLEELNTPVWIHTCSNFLQNVSSEYGHPRYLQDVCIDFPDLTVVAGHGTWPWLDEGCALMWKLPNLYADFSAMRGKYVANNADWAPIMDYGTTVIKDKILFGTSFPLVDDRTQMNDVHNMGLSDEVKSKWLYDNAATVLDI